MTADEFYEALEKAGHQLKRDEDSSVDIWVVDAGFHNGPGCINCGASWCRHCKNTIYPCPSANMPAAPTCAEEML